MAVQLIKVVCSTGKVFYLRQMKVSDTEKAAQKISRRCDGDPLLMQVMIKKALLQQLLAKIADNEEAQPRDVTGNEREDLDSLFSMVEYGQVLQIIGKLSGGDELGNEAKMEFVEG